MSWLTISISLVLQPPGSEAYAFGLAYQSRHPIVDAFRRAEAGLALDVEEDAMPVSICVHCRVYLTLTDAKVEGRMAEFQFEGHGWRHRSSRYDEEEIQLSDFSVRCPRSELQVCVDRLQLRVNELAAYVVAQDDPQ